MVFCEVLIEPDLCCSFCVNSDHSVSDFEGTHLVVALLEAPQRLAEHVDCLGEGERRKVPQTQGDSFVDDFDVELVAAHSSMGGLQVVCAVHLHEGFVLVLPEVVNVELVLNGIERV